MLKILGWAGYEAGLKIAFSDFFADTGISIEYQGVPNQDEMHRVAQLHSFDVACPTTDRIASWNKDGLIAALDDDRIKHNRIDPAFHANAHTLVDGKRMGSPNIWGGAGIGHHVHHAPLQNADVSLMSLFDPAYAGRLAMREDTTFVAAGRALETIGKLPHPFEASYREEKKMIANYDVIGAFLTEHAHHVRRFWFSEEEGTDAFRSGDCVFGYSWDSTMIQLQKENLPFRFVAPSEGAICYLQNFVLGANADPGPAQEWIAWVNTPKGGALYASAFGVNPAAKGATDMMPKEDRAFIDSAYSPEALKNLWWQPEQPVWFVKNRETYARKYRAEVGK